MTGKLHFLIEEAFQLNESPIFRENPGYPETTYKTM